MVMFLVVESIYLGLAHRVLGGCLVLAAADAGHRVAEDPERERWVAVATAWSP